MTLLAISWSPEIKGIALVLIMFLILCGSVYLVLGTNMGARLGLLVSFAGIFGWLAIMGAVWWAYGGNVLKGQEAKWVGQEIFIGADELGNNPLTADLQGSGKWTKLAEDNSGRGQAATSSDEIVLNEAKDLGFASTADYTTVAVYDRGGKRWPRLGPYHPKVDVPIVKGLVKQIDVDFFAIRHTPHYALVEIQPNVRQNTEPGAAPPKPVQDSSKKTIYVLMERDLGYKRVPAAGLAFGSAIIFGVLCYLMHSRDRRSMAARAGSGALVKA